jgi:AAT family amino acid transporter
MLICYSLLGFVVYVALLLLGEMATQYPVAGEFISLSSSSVHPSPCGPGSFTAYAARFVSPGYAFALGWNYWLNDAVSLAGDLLAAQLVVQYWIPAGSTLAAWTWTLSAFLWAALVGVNAINVRAYGELGASTTPTPPAALTTA